MSKKIGPFKHYTTLRAFLSMVDPNLECVRNGKMEFHLSRIDRANDMEEMNYLKDKILKLSGNKGKLQKRINEYFNKKGYPTYISFSFPKGSTISNEVPMWSMYSRHKGSPGICLNFNFDKDYLDNDIKIEKCEYLSKKKLNIKAKSFDTSRISEELIEDIIDSSILSKSNKWRYEKEYRIVQFCKNFDHYAGANEYIEYDKLLIPIQYLKTVFISPFENESVVRKELNKIKEELKKSVQNKECIEFRIHKSTLKIR